MSDVYRNRQPLTDAEFRGVAEHIWLNAFSCIRPSDDFLRDIGRMVVDSVMSSDLRTAPLGDYQGSRACVIWVNAS